MADNSRNDSESVDIMRDLARLSSTPGGKKYILKMLRQAKKISKEAMDQDWDLEKTGERVEKKSADYFKKWSSRKTYFFDLTGIKERNRIRWQLVEVQSKEGKHIIEEVSSRFIKKLDQYEVSPDLIQGEIIELPELDKIFKIGFTKKSETQVQGFIKELEVEVEEEVIEKYDDDFVVRNDSKILVVTKKYKKLKKQEMYQKIKQRMKKHPELIEDIFFYSHMVLKPGGE